jgi:hypothetical protein
VAPHLVPRSACGVRRAAFGVRFGARFGVREAAKMRPRIETRAAQPHMARRKEVIHERH